jgi:hypothetical protein
VELAPDAMSESLGMPGAMVMKAIPSLWSRNDGFSDMKIMDLWIYWWQKMIYYPLVN